ncbi:MAG: tRNA (adenosine(37)-N6)-dimethylallyltransferase MiaA [Ignavibacteriota bacterium]|nr:tRNA (adenosine(37)-N6)-dimethylallyltransferase MiaA [Ignavibacteriota bacterium]MCO6448111.1 tRNA (adenosine(37)-N6)-dimethylallyltransferase MiaA [Ignavibacterium album]MCZ2268586.1 tRNA (adenosine(37)-N6)-dimethylallyltransferase MiaA [Ignavibacteriales bacterium]QKJ98134.1 MAG: tRNA (adenosine(37)-N6)-dimethylallyltransferase MiaA [Ignavibacteriota bacterium]HOJ06722.1 tRNA (adenosine(37)-N6)-dimethylallyltransferase MiaA [Ignavibacteriaceae bacterium]
MKFNLVTILGTTAAGKTKLAVQLADYFNGEIISADSRQVYRGMDVGTGKDLSEYNFRGKQIPYHLIDIIEPSDEFDLYKFKQFFLVAFEKISAKNRLPFLVGGTGMYLSSVLQNYNLKKADFEKTRLEYSLLNDEQLRDILKKLNPSLHNTTDLNDRNRILKAIAVSKALQDEIKGAEINSYNIGIKFSREEIKTRITSRLKKRLDNEGMIDEVKLLLNSGVSYDKMIFFGLEYKFIAQYLKGELSRNDMFQKLNSAIHSFAKRQMTWFRKMEKEGVVINWIDGSDFNKAKELIEKYF